MKNLPDCQNMELAAQRFRLRTVQSRGLGMALAGALSTALGLLLLSTLPLTSACAQTAATPSSAYTWSSLPFGGGGFVDGFLYHPKKEGLLYARTDIGGMYRYDYAAKSWIPLLDHLGREDAELMGVLSMAVDPNDASKLYAATGEYLGSWAHNGAILRSDDQGRTWQKAELSIKVGGNADGRGTGDRLQVDPHNGKILYFGSNQDGLWKSTDGAKSFSKTTSPGQSLSLVLLDPNSKDTLYVGSCDGKGGLFVSHDGGATFSLLPGAPSQVPQHAVFGPDGTLYVTFASGDGKSAVNPSYATSGAVWKMTAEGHWTRISPAVSSQSGAGFGYSGIDIDAKGTLVVSTLDRWANGDDIFRSTDGGAHWQSLGGLSRHQASAYPWLLSYTGGADKMGHWISDVRLNPFNPDEVVYGTGYGLWMSENLSQAGGAQPVMFDFNVKNLEETETLDMMSPTGGATVLAAFGDVGGGAWDDLSKSPDVGLFRPVTETDYAIDSAALKPDVLVRTTSTDATHGFYSEDAGASWQPFASSPYTPKDSKGNWRSPGVIVVSAKASSMVWVPEKDRAFYSLDRGRTWQVSTGWPTGRDRPLTPLADKAIDGVYYVYDHETNSVLISTDNGASFKPLLEGLPKSEGWQSAQLAVVPGHVRDLWLAAPFGLLHSAASDKPAQLSAGVDEAWLVSFGAPAVSGAYPAVFIWGKVKGKQGLYRSDDEGKSFVRINDDAHQFGGFRAISGDPLEFGTLYIAPHGRGLLVGKLSH